MMMGSRKPHPYLHGNFAPVRHGHYLTSCDYIGNIPDDFIGGQYVRNGGNPLKNDDLGREAHWFDGDGMLCGVAFRRARDGSIVPEFVSQYILTDAYLAAVTLPYLRLPIVPSIATLINPATNLLLIFRSIFRTILIIILSNLPGSQQSIKRISVANTNILYHDGRALATCESGPPIRVLLPRLETVGWYDGSRVEGEPISEAIEGEVFGGRRNFSFMKERTTAHPRVDHITKELILFHSTFFSPFVYYSIIPSTQIKTPGFKSCRLINAPIPGIKSAKMMHDMGLSRNYCIIMDLPLSLDPMNLVKNKPVVLYNPDGVSRFGVFPRWEPDAVRWFETSPCCIFHTANTWDEMINDPKCIKSNTNVIAVNMLACRQTSASLVYSAGDIITPTPAVTEQPNFSSEKEQCRLYYYRFLISSNNRNNNTITHQFALSSIPFEFPSLRNEVAMSKARYIYGCSLSKNTFGAALGGATKIDCLVKIDVIKLIDRAHESLPTPVVGCVDNRTVDEIIRSQNIDDPIKIFKLAPGHYAQEPRFVPHRDGELEDDGWLLSYIFDESQLDHEGNARPGAQSELWIINAKNMKEVICKIRLPDRVPYGFHGTWFSEEDIINQKPVETTRLLPYSEKKKLVDYLGIQRFSRAILNLIG